MIMIRKIFLMILLVLLSPYVHAGSADGKGVYCKCEQDKECGNLSIASTEFGVIFEKGFAISNFINVGCINEYACTGLEKETQYSDGYDNLEWSSYYFGMDYSLNRETLLLTEITKGQKAHKFFKRCEVMTPEKVKEKIQTLISIYNQKKDADRKEKTKKNKI